MRYILLILLSLHVIIAQGDNNKKNEYQMPGTGIILGEVINAKLGVPIEYASITLINLETNEIETGQLTDQNGIFVFKEIKNGAPKVVGFFAKRARGMMARYAIQNRIRDPEKLQLFAEGGYAFSPTLSDSTNWVFTRESN